MSGETSEAIASNLRTAADGSAPWPGSPARWSSAGYHPAMGVDWNAELIEQLESHWRHRLRLGSMA
ncbi:hypothetical protein [Kribbella flavida]|uniref:hypothetical protein n=1 Tax=Kribbella flavida TaxID=182640 RepID=UPI001ED8CEE7|nr:hypothetical protein [Kribbella flavida]